MRDNLTKYEQIIRSNTNFLLNVNRIEHIDFPTELNRYLVELKTLMAFDTVLVLQPLNLDSRLESFISNLEQDYSDLAVIRKMDKPDRANALNSITRLTEYGVGVGEYFPMFNETVFKQIIAYPIINANQFNIGNGGVFFLNKEDSFDLNPLMSEAITVVSETITLAYNSYRKKQLYDSSYSIFQATQESTKSAVCIYKSEGIIVFANKYFYELLGKTEEDVLGKKIMNVLNLKEHTTLKDLQTVSGIPNKKLLDDGDAMYSELTKENGEKVFVRKYYKPITLENLWHKMLVLEDITQELENMDSVELSGYYDSLTGLKNRNYFQRDAGRLFAENKLPVAVIVGDINGLKLMNDIFGHNYGDLMLNKIASVLESNCEKGEVYRIGGDEFYMFLNNMDEDEVEYKIDLINRRCKKAFENLNFVGISLGYNIVNSIGANMDSVIRKAETEMYYKKSLSSEKIKNESIASLKKMYMDKFTTEKDKVSRLCKVANEFSSYLVLRDTELTDICNSLELIDIGKVSIDNFISEGNIFNVDDEFEKMKKHCRIGYKIASLSYETSHLARVILNHHENWDGTGFPQGMNGNSIPFLSRIIRLLEYYDSLILNNDQLETTQIIDELEMKKGKLFDPVITEKFIAYLTEHNKD